MSYQISNQIKALNKQISFCERKIKSLPDGALFCTRNGKYTKWYMKNGSHPIYIPKAKQNLAKQLAYKKFIEMHLRELRIIYKKLSEAQQLLLAKPQAEELLEISSPYSELLQSYMPLQNENVQKWLQETYQTNPHHPENLIHQTFAGHKVRSKSEVMIANLLFENQIPYRYESAVVLDTKTYYPDFTICHPKTGQIFYWEHFGKMDEAQYRSNVYRKLEQYARHDIIPTVNLLTTYETEKYPSDSMKFKRIIEEYFLE